MKIVKTLLWISLGALLMFGGIRYIQSKQVIEFSTVVLSENGGKYTVKIDYPFYDPKNKKIYTKIIKYTVVADNIEQVQEYVKSVVYYNRTPVQ